MFKFFDWQAKGYCFLSHYTKGPLEGSNYIHTRPCQNCIYQM